MSTAVSAAARAAYDSAFARQPAASQVEAVLRISGFAAAWREARKASGRVREGIPAGAAQRGCEAA